MALSDQEYVEAAGQKCPFCGSNNIEPVGDLDADGTHATQDVVCHDCEEEWQDVYTLVGYTQS